MFVKNVIKKTETGGYPAGKKKPIKMPYKKLVKIDKLTCFFWIIEISSEAKQAKIQTPIIIKLEKLLVIKSIITWGITAISIIRYVEKVELLFVKGLNDTCL